MTASAVLTDSFGPRSASASGAAAYLGARAKSLCSSRSRPSCFDFAVARFRRSHQRSNENAGGSGDVFDGAIESYAVRFRRTVKSAELPDELERCSTDLFLSRRWLEIKECFDAPAHGALTSDSGSCPAYHASDWQPPSGVCAFATAVQLLNLGRIRGLGAPIASIGGAGVLDGTFVIGLLCARGRRQYIHDACCKAPAENPAQGDR